MATACYGLSATAVVHLFTSAPVHNQYAFTTPPDHLREHPFPTEYPAAVSLPGSPTLREERQGITETVTIVSHPKCEDRSGTWKDRAPHNREVADASDRNHVNLVSSRVG